MKDDTKTKKQLVHELAELRSQDAALKKSTTGSKSADLVAQEAIRLICHRCNSGAARIT